MSKLKVDQITSVSETGSLQLSGNVKPDFSSSNTGLVPPSGTTDQREASPMMGSIRMNTETKILEYYDGTNWLAFQTTISAESQVLAMHYKIYGGSLNTSSAGQRNYVDHPSSEITFTTKAAGTSFLLYADQCGYQAGTGSGVNIAFNFNGTMYAGQNTSNGDTWMGAVHSGISSGSFNLKKMWLVSPNLAAGASVTAYVKCGHWNGSGNHYFNYPSYSPSSTFVIKEIVGAG